MTIRDFSILLAIVASGVGLAGVCGVLHRQRDPARRLAEARQTPFPHLASLMVELLHHLRRLTKGHQLRHHCEQALIAFASLLILIASLVLTETSQCSHHGRSLPLGMILWSVVIEVPRQMSRTSHRTVRPLPALAMILIVLALDMTVILVVVSGTLQGAEASTFGSQAARVAAADVFSALLTLVRVTLDRPSDR